MATVVDISGRFKNRYYELDSCKGCGKVIEEEENYYEIIVPNSFNSDGVTHIALCESCNYTAEVEAGI